jgi:Spy/CpxP family protein refolding chaperone
MKKRILIAAGLIALAAILASVPFAFAQHAGMRHQMADGGAGMMFLGHLGQLKSELNLSDGQTTQIKAIFQSLRDGNAAYRTQFHGGMQQVAQTLLRDPNDLATAQAIIDQQTAAENAMKKNALAAASKALQVLTPDQRSRLSSLFDEHLREMESRRGMLH